MGDSCVAKYWEDNKFYPVEIKGLSKTTAVVLYVEFGNAEEVMLADLRPRGHHRGQQRHQHQSQQPQQFIPATPGLPPAFPQ